MPGTHTAYGSSHPGQTTSDTVSTRRPCLVLFGEDGADAIPLTQETTRLGRGPRCDLRVDDRRVSGVHAAVRQTPDGYVLDDLGSTNGTTVNGVLIQSVLLRVCDRIELAGAVELIFADRLVTPRARSPRRSLSASESFDEIPETESRFGCRPEDGSTA